MFNQVIAEATKKGWEYAGQETMEIRFTALNQTLVVYGTRDYSIEWVMSIKGQRVSEGDGWTLPVAKQN